MYNCLLSSFSVCHQYLSVCVGKPMKGQPQQIVGAFMAPQLVEPLRDQEVREGVPAVFECKISATPGE